MSFVDEACKCVNNRRSAFARPYRDLDEVFRDVRLPLATVPGMNITLHTIAMISRYRTVLNIRSVGELFVHITDVNGEPSCINRNQSIVARDNCVCNHSPEIRVMEQSP